MIDAAAVKASTDTFMAEAKARAQNRSYYTLRMHRNAKENQELKRQSRSLPVGTTMGSFKNHILLPMVNAMNRLPKDRGLAAPQIGIPVRVLMIRKAGSSNMCRVFVNPIAIIPEQGQKALTVESDSSYRTGFTPKPVAVQRWLRFDVLFLDLDQDAKDDDLVLQKMAAKETLEGQEAIDFQHYCDYLDGILFSDIGYPCKVRSSGDFSYERPDGATVRVQFKPNRNPKKDVPEPAVTSTPQPEPTTNASPTEATAGDPPQLDQRPSGDAVRDLAGIPQPGLADDGSRSEPQDAAGSGLRQGSGEGV